jgi:hemerythrin superfamily protein
MDAIQMIEADHRQFERSFGRFDRAARSGDAREQARVARDIVRELSAHAAVEEQAVYPALARAGVAAERLDALEDHHAVKVALAELQATTPADERFAAKVRLVAKNVLRHVEEEESTLLPRLREALDPVALQRPLRGPRRPRLARPERGRPGGRRARAPLAAQGRGAGEGQARPRRSSPSAAGLKPQSPRQVPTFRAQSSMGWSRGTGLRRPTTSSSRTGMQTPLR